MFEYSFFPSFLPSYPSVPLSCYLALLWFLSFTFFFSSLLLSLFPLSFLIYQCNILKREKKPQLVEFSCSCVLNPPPFLCFSEHYLIISFQNLESYHGNSLPTLSFEKDPSSPQRNHLQVAIQLPLLCSVSVLTHYLLSDLGQEPCQWPVKWNSIQSGWFRLGHILLSSWPVLRPLLHLPWQEVN